MHTIVKSLNFYDFLHHKGKMLLIYAIFTDEVRTFAAEF